MLPVEDEPIDELARLFRWHPAAVIEPTPYDAGCAPRDKAQKERPLRWIYLTLGVPLRERSFATEVNRPLKKARVAMPNGTPALAALIDRLAHVKRDFARPTVFVEHGAELREEFLLYLGKDVLRRRIMRVKRVAIDVGLPTKLCGGHLCNGFVLHEAKQRIPNRSLGTPYTFIVLIHNHYLHHSYVVAHYRYMTYVIALAL